MSNLLLVNADGPEKRIALLENSELCEFYVERPGEGRMTYTGLIRSCINGVLTLDIDGGEISLALHEVARANLTRGLESLSFGDAMAIGCAQAIALIPGVSRSGITITTGIFKKLTREASARFTFLLSTPIIAGSKQSHLLCAMT